QGVALAAGSNGTRQKVMRTTDGVNWSNVSGQLAANSTVSFLAIAPSAGGTWYAGVVDNGTSSSAPVNAPPIRATTTSGSSWTTTATGLPTLAMGLRPNAGAVDWSTPGRAFAAFGGSGGGAVYMTTDSGGSWNPINGSGVNAIAGAVTGV